MSFTRESLRPVVSADTFAQLQIADRDLTARRPDTEGVPQLRVELHVDDDRGYYVGTALVELDRELRRYSKQGSAQAGAALMQVGESPARTAIGDLDSPDLGKSARSSERKAELDRPEPPDRSSLRLLATSHGSADMWLEPLGLMVSALSSSPTVALVNSFAVIEHVSRVRLWMARRAQKRVELDAEDALAAQRAARSLIADREADLDLEFPATTLYPGVRMRASGMRISYYRQNPDGSIESIVVDGRG